MFKGEGLSYPREQVGTCLLLAIAFVGVFVGVWVEGSFCGFGVFFLCFFVGVF